MIKLRRRSQRLSACKVGTESKRAGAKMIKWNRARAHTPLAPPPPPPPPSAAATQSSKVGTNHGHVLVAGRTVVLTGFLLDTKPPDHTVTDVAPCPPT